MKKQDLVNLVKGKLLLAGFQPGESLILAVSGGSDSMALLDVFAHLRSSYDLQLTVVHINHGLRVSSIKDQQAVEKYCQKHNLLCLVKRVNLGARLKKDSAGVEEKARKLRYAALRQAASKMKARFIVTAHHRDDQVETIILNFLRGSGLRGLGGMKDIAGDIMRPFLNIPKSEFLAYVKKYKIPYVLDPTNQSVAFTRNRIRHQLLPVLRKYNPAIDQLLSQNSYVFQQADAVIGDIAKHYLSLMRDPKTDKVSISISKLLELTPFMQVEVLKVAIREVLDNLEQMKKVHFDEIFKLVRAGQARASKALPGKLFVDKAYDKITISRKP